MNSPITVAFVFDEELSSGGAFQQTLTAALQAVELDPSLIHPIFVTTYAQSRQVLSEQGLHSFYFKTGLVNRLLSRARLFVRSASPRIYEGLRRFSKYSRFERFLVHKSVDLAYFLSPSFLQLDLEDTNYISTVWDLCHLDQPEFPEVRLRSEHTIRQSLYSWILPRSTAIIADSYAGKQNIIRHYQIDPDRILISPFLSSTCVREYVSSPSSFPPPSNLLSNLPEEFIFYPAQFWPHKNHVYLLKGLSILADNYGKRISLVLCGSNKGTLSHVKRYAENLNISHLVHYLGFVPSTDIPHLFAKSTAVVMPTYFGLTNLPPLEAFHIGTPLIYSDLPYLRDQVSGAALLVDLQDPTSLADAINQILESEDMRQLLIRNGHLRYAELTTSNFPTEFSQTLRQFRSKRETWQSN